MARSTKQLEGTGSISVNGLTLSMSPGMQAQLNMDMTVVSSANINAGNILYIPNNELIMDGSFVGTPASYNSSTMIKLDPATTGKVTLRRSVLAGFYGELYSIWFECHLFSIQY